MNAPPNTELIESGPSTLGRVAAEAIANTLSGVGLGLLTGVALWAFGCTWPTTNKRRPPNETDSQCCRNIARRRRYVGDVRSLHVRAV